MKTAPSILGVLGSGAGSNCCAILEAIERKELNAEVAVIVSDQAESGILRVAKQFGVRGVFLPPGNPRARLETAAEELLVGILRDAGVEWIILAGFMRILKASVLQAFPRRIINIHPSLLPKFPGKAAWEQALRAGEKKTGCTVHYVDAGIDTGEIIAQKEVPILPGDTPESLHHRIQLAEHVLYPAVIRQLMGAER